MINDLRPIVWVEKQEGSSLCITTGNVFKQMISFPVWIQTRFATVEKPMLNNNQIMLPLQAHQLGRSYNGRLLVHVEISVKQTINGQVAQFLKSLLLSKLLSKWLLLCFYYRRKRFPCQQQFAADIHDLFSGVFFLHLMLKKTPAFALARFLFWLDLFYVIDPLTIALLLRGINRCPREQRRVILLNLCVLFAWTFSPFGLLILSEHTNHCQRTMQSDCEPRATTQLSFECFNCVQPSYQWLSINFRLHSPVSSGSILMQAVWLWFFFLQ